MSIPYFPLYVSDYDADTAHLTLEEDGAYLRLLRLCWRTPGCSVPDDAKWIMRKLRISADDYYRVVEPLIDEFFTRGMDRVFSARLQREFEDVKDKHKKRSDAGKLGNEKRWGLKTKDKVDRKATVLQSQPEPEPEPIKRATNVAPKKDSPQSVLEKFAGKEAVSGFIEMRKAIRKPLTVYAAGLIAKKLEGQSNADAVLNLSTENNWAGVFPDSRQFKNGVKINGNGNYNERQGQLATQSFVDENARAAEIAIARIGRRS